MDYIGTARLLDSWGELHSVEARLEWTGDNCWAGTLLAQLDWPSLADDRLFLDLPSNRWWDTFFVSPVVVDRMGCDWADVHGSVPQPNTSLRELVDALAQGARSR